MGGGEEGDGVDECGVGICDVEGVVCFFGCGGEED